MYLLLKDILLIIYGRVFIQKKIAVTFRLTQVIFDGGIVNGLNVNNIIAINYLKYSLTVQGLVLEQNLGVLRSTSVIIGGGITWVLDFPIESKIKEELEELINQENKTKNEIAIEVMLWVMRRQIFIDGNKRVALLFANKIMIDMWNYQYFSRKSFKVL